MSVRLDIAPTTTACFLISRGSTLYLYAKSIILLVQACQMKQGN